MAGLLYELTLAAFFGRVNGWFCGVSRREKGSGFGRWFRRLCSGVPNFGLRVRERAGTVADFGCGGRRYRLRSTSHGAIFSDLSVHAVGREWVRGAEGEMKKGSSDAEDAIGW